MLSNLIILADRLEQSGFTKQATQVGSVVAASLLEADDQTFDQFIVEAKGGWKQKVLPLMMGLGLGAGGVGDAPAMESGTPGQQSGHPTEQSFTQSINDPRLTATATKLGKHLAKYMEGGVDELDMNIQEAEADVLAAFGSILAGKASAQQATQFLLKDHKVPQQLSDIILGIMQQIERAKSAPQTNQPTQQPGANGAGNSMVSSY